MSLFTKVGGVLFLLSSLGLAWMAVANIQRGDLGVAFLFALIAGILLALPALLSKKSNKLSTIGFWLAVGCIVLATLIFGLAFLIPFFGLVAVFVWIWLVIPFLLGLNLFIIGKVFTR